MLALRETIIVFTLLGYAMNDASAYHDGWQPHHIDSHHDDGHWGDHEDAWGRHGAHHGGTHDSSDGGDAAHVAGAHDRHEFDKGDSGWADGDHHLHHHDADGHHHHASEGAAKAAEDAEGAKRYSYFTQGNGPDGFYSKGYFGSEGYEHELAKAREEEDAHGDGYKKLEHHTDSADAHGGHGHDHAAAEHGHYDAGHKHHGADHSEHGGSHEHSEDGWRKGHDKDEWQSGTHH